MPINESAIIPTVYEYSSSHNEQAFALAAVADISAGNDIAVQLTSTLGTATMLNRGIFAIKVS